MCNMKSLVLLLSLVGAVIAQESTRKPVPEIITEVSNVNLDGYNFQFKTSDGVQREEEAHLITVGDHQGIGIKGSYSYDGADGQKYIVTFTADEKGFRPEIQTVPAGKSNQ